MRHVSLLEPEELGEANEEGFLGEGLGFFSFFFFFF